MRMDYRVEEFWLLNLAVEHEVLVSELIPFQGLGLNSPSLPNSDDVKHKELLVDLFARGLVDVFHIGKNLIDVDRSLRRVQQRDIDTLISSAISRRSLAFELTNSGGEMWERFAEPKWDLFITQSLGENNGIIYSQNLDRLVACLGSLRYLSGATVDLKDVRLKKEAEFQVLYWKTLPDVFVAEFGMERLQSPDPDVPDWFINWQNRIWNWHVEPWDTAQWQELDAH
jgi:hypothetical protein